MPRQSPELSPSLTAISSASTFASSSYQPERLPKDFGSEFDMAMDQTMEITDYLLAIDEEDHSTLSQSHSPTTMSPNQTPSPVLGARSPVAWSPSDHLAFPSSPAAGPSTSFPDFSFGDEFAKMPEAGPSSLPMEAPTIKQEPVEFGWSDALPAVATQPQLDLNPAAAVVPPVMTTAAPAAQPAALPSNYNLTPQDQAILMELLRNLTDQTMQAMLAPKTIAPSDLTKTVDPALLANAPPTPVSPPIAAQAAVPNPAVPAPAQPTASAASVPAKRRVSEAVLDDIAEDEPLNAVSPEDEAKARRDRSMSTFDMHDLDLEAKLDMLVPSEAIFSAGRGKGGKKGGGMSSVVRGDDEDLDEDDSWRPSPEEYKKLSSKEKRQLRNKLSARAFRTRRKDYISTLEGHIKDRDAVIDAIKAELVNTRSENLDLKKELDALKASAMTVLHPETAFKPSPAPAATANVVMASTSAQPQANKPASAPAPTPKFSTRKDLPSSPAIAKSFWGGGNGPLGHHGNMTVHTLFTPELGLPPVRPIDASRENLNPLLNDSSAKQRYRTYPLSHSTAGAADMSSSFADWSEDNAFSLRSLDSYRTQMWSRLTREAHAEKMGIAAGSRAKFFTPRDGKASEPSKETTSAIEQTDLAARLADSVILAFAHPYDSDSHSPLTDIVTGKSRPSHDDKGTPIDKEEENRRKKLSPTYEADEQLAMALGGLRLQSGFTSPREYRGALAHSWENPMGALADMLTFGLGPTGRA